MNNCSPFFLNLINSQISQIYPDPSQIMTRTLMMNKTIELGEITPYHFGKKLVIPLDERWSEYLTAKNETFKVVIKDNKLMLIGQLSPITKSTASKQEISDFD